MIIFILNFLISLLARAEAPFSVLNAEVRELSPGQFELREYRRESPPEFVLKDGVKMLSCRHQKKKCPGNRFVLTPDFRKGDQVLELRYQTGGGTAGARLHLLPPGFPTLTTFGRSVLERPLIFSAMALHEKDTHECHLFRLTPDSDVDFYRKIDRTCFDLRPHEYDGRKFYSYAEIAESILYVGYLGPRVILDEHFRETGRLAPENDMHEFLLQGPDHWIGIEIELGRLSNGKAYFNKRIRERKGGKIIFDWGTSDILAQYNSEAATHMFQTFFRNETVAELFHFNAIQILKDGFLIGLGHDGIGYLDRGSKKLRWVLGGIHDTFDLPVGKTPLFNHSPVLNESTGVLHVFSNKSFDRPTNSSARIIRYQLDLKRPEVKDFKRLRQNGEEVSILGSLQVTGDVLSIGMGSKEKAEWDFVEMRESGAETWKLALPKRWAVYRFYRGP